MAHNKSFGLPFAVLVLSCLGAVLPSAAQTSVSRLAGDGQKTVAMQTAPATLPYGAVDLGAAPANVSLERMLLLLTPTAAQQQALSAKLTALQDKSSPQYQQWLTAAEFASNYANSPANVAAVAAWLSSQGFQVATLPNGRGWIEFSGTVAQVQQAFGAQVEAVSYNGSTRYLLQGSVHVPPALQPLITGLVSLDGTLSAAAVTTPVAMNTPLASLVSTDVLSQAEALTPQLAGQLLQWKNLHDQGTLGAGQSIAIAARSNILPSDFAAFRSAFGLPAGALSIQPNGVDPGLTDDEPVAALAAQWAGATAPGAQIVVVPAATTAATDGIDLALAAIIDQKLAGSVAVGYSLCESSLSAAHQAFYAALYQQAAAEGISVVAATGDTGAAGCSAAGGTTPVSSGYAVNALSSTPWNTAVGAAGFTAADRSTLAAWAPANTAEPAFAGGGGASQIYDAPSWQAAVVPSASTTFSASVRASAHSVYKSWLTQSSLSAKTAAAASAATLASGYRLLPDVALPTASDASVNPGLAYCLSSSTGATGCTLVRSGGSAASAAIFAGVSALLGQSYGAQGNLNSRLYALSSTSGVFADVTVGSAQLSCTAGSTGCGATQQIGFPAATGYDLTSGLGSIHTEALVKNFAHPLASGGSNDAIAWSALLSSQSLPIVLSSTQGLTLDALVNSTSTTPNQAFNGSINFVDTLSAIGSSTTSSATYLASSPSTSGFNSASENYAEYTYALQAGLLSAGVYHSFVANYQGDSYYSSLSTAPLTVVIPAATQVNWTTPSQSIAATAPLNLTASVGTASSSLGSVPSWAAPAGSVNFINVTSGNALLGSATIASGAATYAMPAGTLPSGGSYLLHACYQATATFTASCDSSDIRVTVPAAAQIAWQTKAQTINSATPLTLTVQVASNDSTVTSTPTGTVVFTDSTTGTVLGSDGLASGLATITLGAGELTSGISHTLTATYQGNTTSSPYFASATTSNNIAIAVTAASSTSWMTVSQTVLPTSPLTLTAQVVSNDGTVSSVPTGTVTFFDLSGSGTTLGTAPVVSNGSVGIATLTLATNPLSASTLHTLQASYGGNLSASNTLFAASNTSAANIGVTVPSAASVTWKTAAQSIASTAALTLTVQVAATSTGVTTVPSGTVTFTDSTTGNVLGTGTVLATGSASCAVAAGTLAEGSVHAIVASYGGSSASPYFSTATSSALNITATVASKITWATAAQTVLSGANLTLNATVASGDTTVTAFPSGTVTFTDASTGNVLGTVAVGATGQATLTVSAGSLLLSGATATLATGMTHSIQAVFTSSATASTIFATSSSSGLAIFTPANSTIVWVNTLAKQTIDATQTVTLNVKVASADSTVTSTPTGTVAFNDLSSSTTPLLSTATLTASGTVQLTLAAGALTTGTHVIQAVYSGSTIYGTSTTATTITILVTAKINTAVVLTVNSTTIAPEATLVLTATVTPDALATLEAYPTGTVEFMNGTTLIGSATLYELGVSDVSVATLSVSNSSALPAGNDTITAIYMGDTYYQGETSNPVIVDVQDFTITADASNPATYVSIVKGGSGSATFDIAGLGGFNGTIQVTCSVPASDYMGCAATPQQLTPPGNVTFVVTTYTTGSASTASMKHEKAPLWPRAMGGTALAMLGFFLLPFGRRARLLVTRAAGERRRKLLMLLLLLGGIGLTGVGCSSTSGTAATNPSGTSLGAATLAITANAYINNTVVSHTVYLNVNVVASGS